MSADGKTITADEEAARWERMGTTTRDARIWTALHFAARLQAHAPESHRALLEAALVLAKLPEDARLQEGERICGGDLSLMELLNRGESK